jgi:VWFA-related protein
MGCAGRFAWGMVCAATLCGQTADPVIRSTIRLVQVHVVAVDSQGNRVADLRRRDFQILDNHKPQLLTLFSADRGTPASSGATASPGGASGNGGGYAVILLDWLNTSYTDQFHAKDHVIQLLRNFEPREQVALYLLGRQPRLLCGFTSSRAALLQAVSDVEPEFDELEHLPVGRFDARYGNRAGTITPEERLFHQTNQVQDTLHTLGAIADILARAPGRKTLVWLSSGFPELLRGRGGAVETSFADDVERVLAWLNNSDVAVYPVDAQGLSALPHGDRGTLLELASRTGGTAFYDRNDLDEGMRLALEDMSVSYTLGFHVPEGALPGLHEIAVRVGRQGLRYRESYQLAGN